MAYRRGVRGVRTPIDVAKIFCWYFNHRMRQNTVFSTKNTKNFLGRGHSPSPDLSPSGEGTPFSTPHPPRRLDPLHAEILGTPLLNLVRIWPFAYDEWRFSRNCKWVQILWRLSFEIWPWCWGQLECKYSWKPLCASLMIIWWSVDHFPSSRCCSLSVCHP